jgi:phosphopantothenoylcysteine synthetase/decarboxylase
LAAPIQKKIQKVADILIPAQPELPQIEETKSISNGSTGDTPEQL